MTRFRPMLRRHGLTEQQWRVIRVLAAGHGIDASELARRSFLLAPSLTRILQSFELKKIIKRAPDASDQRRAVFELTAKGAKIFAAVAPDSEALYVGIAQEFGMDKLAILYTLLAEFSAALSNATITADEAEVA